MKAPSLAEIQILLGPFSGNKRLDLTKRSPAVQSLIRKTITYLRKRSAEDPTAQIRPAMLALALGENEMIALTAPNMLQNAGITKEHPGLYCDATMQWLGEFEPGGSVPGALPCDVYFGEQHDFDSGTMRRELFFIFDPKALSELKEAA
jgi:hypothetical protein